MDARLTRGRYRGARRQPRWQAGSVGPRRGLGGGARVKVGRGAVVVELDPTVGREQHGVRPCVVVSDPDVIGDQRFPLVCVVPVTGTPGEGLLYPPLAPGQSGLAKKSFALIDHPILTPPASSSLFFKRSCPLRAIEIPMGNCFLSLPPPPPGAERAGGAVPGTGLDGDLRRCLVCLSFQLPLRRFRQRRNTSSTNMAGSSRS